MTDLAERRPAGRPKGSRNKNRAATVETIANQADPIGWQVRALKRGWVRGKGGVREYLDPDQKISLAVGLGRKILPDLRTADVTAIKVEGTNIIVQTGIARLPNDPPIDVTPLPASPADDGASPAESSISAPAPDAVALLAGRPRHAPLSPPMDAPQPALSPTLDRRHDDNLDRARTDDAKIATLNSRAAKFVA
jgi:hypothetical protein